MRTEKEKLLLVMPKHEMIFARKCAMASKLSFSDFFNKLINENCFEFANYIREMSGEKSMDKKAIIKQKLPPKKDTSKKGEK